MLKNKISLNSPISQDLIQLNTDLHELLAKDVATFTESEIQVINDIYQFLQEPKPDFSEDDCYSINQINQIIGEMENEVKKYISASDTNYQFIKLVYNEYELLMFGKIVDTINALTMGASDKYLQTKIIFRIVNIIKSSNLDNLTALKFLIIFTCIFKQLDTLLATKIATSSDANSVKSHLTNFFSSLIGASMPVFGLPVFNLSGIDQTIIGASGDLLNIFIGKIVMTNDTSIKYSPEAQECMSFLKTILLDGLINVEKDSLEFDKTLGNKEQNIADLKSLDNLKALNIKEELPNLRKYTEEILKVHTGDWVFNRLGNTRSFTNYRNYRSKTPG